MMKRMIAAAAALLLAAGAEASGLRTPFGEVVVRNLKIGQTYSLYKLVNLPLRVINTGDADVDLSIETIESTSDTLRAGYEALPNVEWIKVETSSFTLGPNREASSDLILSIPNDPKLLGRRFEGHIWSHTRSLHGTYGVGIISRLMLHIDSTPPTEDELKKKFVDERVANLDFTVLPSENDIGIIPLARDIDLRKEKKVAIKLINPNDRALNFRVRSIPVWESLIAPPDGYEGAFNPQWLTPQKSVVEVEGNSIADTSLTLNVPDEPRVRGKKLFFIVSIEVLEQKIPTRVYYRLRATMPDPEKGALPKNK
jgi:hypothetical protein